jgi:hypothetical protein
MFGTDAAFNPDLLSGRLEEILPTIQQVIVPKITAVGLLRVRLLVGLVNSTHRPCCGTGGTAETATFFLSGTGTVMHSGSVPDPDLVAT